MNKVATVSKTKKILKKHDFYLKKKYGQNFLVDQNILNKIMDTAAVHKNDVVIEIGAGAGALTQLLAEQAKTVVAFEIDTKLEPVLNDTLAGFTNIKTIFADFLLQDIQVVKNNLPPNYEALKVVANLPYYITTPILEKLISWYVYDNVLNLTSATVMMQKEVAQRLIAKPKSKSYGSLSIFTQLFADVEIAFIVPRTVFVPAPNVDSAVVHVRFKTPTFFQTFEEAEAFMTFVRQCFANRRKTLVNNLKKLYAEQLIQDIRMEFLPTVRAEELSVEELYNIFRKIHCL